MVGFTVAVGAFALATGILSRALLVDLVSLWPGALLTVATVPPVWAARRRSHRVQAIPPLVLFTWLVLGSAAHLAGWALLPSSAAELVGPATADGPVALTVTVDGRMVVTAGGGDWLYLVRFLRRGGPVGVPVAEEQGDPLTVTVRGEPGGTWFQFAGWQIELSPDPRWTLNFDPGDGSADVDLRGLDVDKVRVSGSGALWLGEGAGTVEVAGTYTISVPTGAPVRVVGAATVPDDWLPTSDGWRSPVDGPGWQIQVLEGAAVAMAVR